MQGKYPELRLVVQVLRTQARLLCLWLPPEGSLAPQNLVFEGRSGSATLPPSYFLPAPRTVAALPGVVSHPRIRHPPPPALQGIHISQTPSGLTQDASVLVGTELDRKYFDWRRRDKTAPRLRAARTLQSSGPAASLSLCKPAT
ncbi:hypothetical protein CapIbe_006691 [Capra ibex]